MHVLPRYYKVGKLPINYQQFRQICHESFNNGLRDCWKFAVHLPSFKSRTIDISFVLLKLSAAQTLESCWLGYFVWLSTWVPTLRRGSKDFELYVKSGTQRTFGEHYLVWIARTSVAWLIVRVSVCLAGKTIIILLK